MDIICRGCGRELDEDLGGERPQCPNCGSFVREHRVAISERGVTMRDGINVTVNPRAAPAFSSAPVPAASIEEAVKSGTFTRTIIWSKTPDAWLAEVRDASGSLVGVEVNFDAMDAMVILVEHLLPPGE